MELLTYVRRIAVADQPSRREALLAQQRELDSPFVHYRDLPAEHRPENIVVRLGGETPRLVIGAHYDSVPGSTGANDNAAGVAVLLACCERSCTNYRAWPSTSPSSIWRRWGSQAAARIWNASGRETCWR